MRALFAAALVALVTASCATSPTTTAPGPASPEATLETRALFKNLRTLAADGKVLFGHHDALAYGYQWRADGRTDRSDVKLVTGSHPAVYGWDANRLFRRGAPDSADPRRAAELRRYILAGHRRGGVTTLAWHMPNPSNDTDSWNVEGRPVAAMLPGGALHADYKAKLDVVAAFFRSLRTREGEPVPVFFRPFHEHTGDWFWWGKAHCTPEEFVALWRFTAEYLRDAKGVQNVLWAYSPDVFDSEAAYLERYPGDAYVDLLGYDDYHSVKTAETREVFVSRLRLLTGMAAARGKLAALTETGVEAVPDPRWFTQVLAPALKAEGVGPLSYVLVWRNANPARDREDHFYAPYPGHPAAADLKAFRDDPAFVFEDEAPDLFRFPPRETP